jgi:hypothetical protein
VNPTAAQKRLPNSFVLFFYFFICKEGGLIWPNVEKCL